jgi:hypothetical protein
MWHACESLSQVMTSTEPEGTGIPFRLRKVFKTKGRKRRFNTCVIRLTHTPSIYLLAASNSLSSPVQRQ